MKIKKIPMFMNFYKLNINNYELILSKISKMALKPTPSLDYAIIKFTSSVPGIISILHAGCTMT